MSLFDEDDFFSPKIPRTVQRMHVKPSGKVRKSGFGKGWSPLKISVVSSVCTTVVVILLLSWITGIGEPRGNSGNDHIASAEAGADLYDRIVQLADEVPPSIVSIVNSKDKDGIATQAGLGSGIIFAKDNGRALILTNTHVIEGASSLEIELNTGVRKEAKLVGKDTTSDIAVLSVVDEGIPKPVVIGDSTKLRRGETVLAIGNALGLGESLSSGIVSKTSVYVPVSLSGDGTQDWEREAIQTDAAINEGNSGGALVNMRGEVIGVNAMKISDIGVEGIGFAIPMNNAMEIAHALIQDGRVIRPYLGVYTIDLNNPYAPITEEARKDLKLPADQKDGVIVMEATGPAGKTGLKLNDVIVKFDNEPVETTVQLRKYLYDKKKVGDTLSVTYYREGKEYTVDAILTDRPQE